MRLALKHAVLFFVAYLVGMGGFALAAQRWLDRTAWGLMEETAVVVGREIGSAVARPLLEQLGEPGPGSQARLARALDELALRSPLVLAATLVGPSGEALASTEAAGRERGYPGVDALFAEDPRPRLSGIEGPDLESGRFVLEVPLLQEGQPRAYLRLSLGSSRLAGLYADARWTLTLVVVLGLVAIGGLGYLLQLQFARRDRAVEGALERALAGESISDAGATDPELRRQLAAAERLGRALRAERTRSGRAERGLASVGQLLDVGVLVVDGDDALEFAGHQATALLGLETETEARWPAVHEQLEATLSRARRTGARAIRDLEITRAEGSVVPVRCQAQLLEEGEGRLLVVLRDRRLLQALEADLREAAHSRGLARLYVGAAHDLKAPLNAVTLNLELLRQSLGDEDSPESEEARLETLRVVEEELARLRRSLETLLDQTAPGARSPGQIDLRHLLEDSARLLGAQASQQRVELQLSLPQESLDVRCQPDAVRQALLNVAINALDAMPAGGRLTISAQREGNNVRIRVADSGAGIPDEVRERIFDLHVTTKATGTGIGLYVARSILEAEGGRLELETTGTDGTAFGLTLPAVKEAAA